jgi:cell wall-associated NlpC family hydrolase
MSRLVESARKYRGVRFVHRGRRASKLDCVGLVWRAFRDIGVDVPCPNDYGREPQHERFRAAIEEALGPPIALDQLQPGDVVTLKSLRHPHHVAIVCDHPNGLGLIHASGEHGRVVEHRLDPSYFARIVTAHRRSA